jgi:1,4-dihydroxy-6-naphthoate synthase
LTYSRKGFHKVLDLGRWWKTKFDLPLPWRQRLLRSLAPDIQSERRMMRESIQYALDNREEAVLRLAVRPRSDARLADKLSACT